MMMSTGEPKKRGRKRSPPEETERRIVELFRAGYRFRVRKVRGYPTLTAMKKIDGKWRERYIAPYDKTTDEITHKLANENEELKRRWSWRRLE
jgi:hypothetical protein